MRRRALVVALAVALGVVAPAVRAQPDATGDAISYRVRPGDSLELIAAEFYGDHNFAIFIMVENKLQHPRALHAGERIKIPVTREVTTAAGDDFKSLAQTYLGDESRASYLADFNKLSLDDSLAAGTTLTIPFHVTHVAAGTETLASISAAYFGDPKEAELLRAYNNLGKTSLDKGEAIVIPILNVRVREGKLPPIDGDARTRREHQIAARADADVALPRARAAWIAGDFAGVKSALAHVADEVDFLDAATAMEIGLLLGKAYVAFDETELAVAKFAQVLARKRGATMSAYTESPKVRAAWVKAGGKVDGE